MGCRAREPDDWEDRLQFPRLVFLTQPSLLLCDVGVEGGMPATAREHSCGARNSLRRRETRSQLSLFGTRLHSRPKTGNIRASSLRKRVPSQLQLSPGR
jgi:hypothetical protein